MTRNRLIACGIICCSLAGGAAMGSDSPASAKATALRAVAAFFLEPSAQNFASFFDPTADWKNKGPGSAVTKVLAELKTEGKQIVELVSVKEVIFFMGDDIPSLKKRFPDGQRMWDAQRIPARLKDPNALGCLVVWKRTDSKDPEDIRLNALVFKKVEKDYKIVYLDDM